MQKIEIEIGVKTMVTKNNDIATPKEIESTSINISVMLNYLTESQETTLSVVGVIDYEVSSQGFQKGVKFMESEDSIEYEEQTVPLFKHTGSHLCASIQVDEKGINDSRCVPVGLKKRKKTSAAHPVQQQTNLNGTTSQPQTAGWQARNEIWLSRWAPGGLEDQKLEAMSRK